MLPSSLSQLLVSLLVLHEGEASEFPEPPGNTAGRTEFSDASCDFWPIQVENYEQLAIFYNKPIFIEILYYFFYFFNSD